MEKFVPQLAQGHWSFHMEGYNVQCSLATKLWSDNTGLRERATECRKYVCLPVVQFSYSETQSPNGQPCPSQEIPSISWNPEVQCRIHNSPSPSWATTINATAPHHTSWKSNLILPSHLGLRSSNGLFPSGLPTKTMFAPLLSPHVLHAPPISFFSISSPERYLLRSTNHKAVNYLFSIPLLPRPSLAQISPYSQTTSGYVPPSTWATHTKQAIKRYLVCIF